MLNDRRQDILLPKDDERVSGSEQLSMAQTHCTTQDHSNHPNWCWADTEIALRIYSETLNTYSIVDHHDHFKDLDTTGINNRTCVFDSKNGARQDVSEASMYNCFKNHT